MVGGLNQSNNSANTATVLNVRTPGDVRGAAIQLNSGSSCQIISEYRVGGAVVDFAIWRGSVKFLSFYSATTLTCNVAFQTGELQVSSVFRTGITSFTASGAISTPVSLCSASSNIILTLPATPASGQNARVVNQASTSLVTVTGTGLASGWVIGGNSSCLFVFNGTVWTVASSSDVRAAASNFSTVSESSTVSAPVTIVTGSAATTQTLPAPSAVPVGRVYTVTNDSSASVTVDAPGRSSMAVAQNSAARFMSTGSQWILA